jgi:hypothetical protein
MGPRARNKILVLGPAAFDATEFARRGLELKPVSATEALTHFNSARAVIVSDAPGKFSLIKDLLSDLFLRAEDHELAPVVLTHSLADLAQVSALRDKDHPGSKAKIFQTNELWKAAEWIARHDVGPPAGDVKIEPSSLPLSTDEALLLRRAFSDCDEIFVESLPGGRASMSVYRVHARLQQSDVGRYPLPFFVKIDGPEEINSESQRYHRYAELYIPSHLRPKLDKERCICTRSCAALVGSFVDDAVPLRRWLLLGQGSGILHALFEKSLKGFRLQPFATGQKPFEGVLAGFVKNRIKAENILTQIVEHARREFGVSRSPEEMEAVCCAEAEKLACLMGPCHGDLHSGNVMVRGGDAMLIDFSSAGDGPMTADPAALEVSLMFGTDEDDDANSFAAWREFTDQIYDGNVQSLHPPALSESKPGRFSWLRRSIRELRHILLGCNVGESEAKIVLAAYLMRYARLGADALKKGDTVAFERHAYALAVAERIMLGFSAMKPPKGGP